MQRRSVLTALGSAAAIGFSGCSEITEDIRQSEHPNPEVRNPLYADPEPISADVDTNSQQFTTENTGISGNIEIALYWKLDTDGHQTPTTTRPIAPYEGYSFDSKKSVYFNEGERRTTQFSGTAPDDTIGYEFVADSLTYGAEIYNAGSAGDIRTIIEIGYDTDDLEGFEDQVVFIDEDETEDVLFDIHLTDRHQWKIEAGIPN